MSTLQSVLHLDIVQQESAAVLLHLHEKRPQNNHPWQAVPLLSVVGRPAPHRTTGDTGRKGSLSTSQLAAYRAQTRVLRLRTAKDALKDAAAPVKVWLRVLGSVSLSKVQVSLAGAPSIMASSHAQALHAGLVGCDGCCFGSYKVR